MAKKPIADMAILGVSKEQAAQAVPFAAPPRPVTQATVGLPKSLTIKLNPETYAALRAYCYEQERATGSRVTHQAVMVQALEEMLTRRKAT
jgi:acyl transferase domain-containing protein